MAYGKKDLASRDKETLLLLIDELQMKLKKKNIDLHRTRTKLKLARTTVMRMKATVNFQRQRILELHA